MTDTCETMRAFGANEEACYRWPDDTPEHRALRSAFIDGAAKAGADIDQLMAEIERLRARIEQLEHKSQETLICPQS